MPSLFLFDKAGEELEFPIGPELSEVKIGRSAGNDLRIRAPSISRNHATLLIQNGQFYLEDGGSSNGTYVNGKRLAPSRPVPVSLGDSIKFGEVLVRFEEAGKGAKSTLPFVSPPAPQVQAGPASLQPPPWPAPPASAKSPSEPPLVRAETARPRPSLDGGLDLSHMLDAAAPPPVAAPGKPDPLAGLFEDFGARDLPGKQSPVPAAAEPSGPPLPKPGEGPVELNLDDLLGDEPEGRILEIQQPAAPPDFAGALDRLFDLGGPAVPPPQAGAPPLAAPPPLGPAAEGDEEGLLAKALEPLAGPPLVLPGGAASPAPAAVPGASLPDPASRIAELEEELESRKNKIDSLQKAARRDAELKKKLQDEKADLELQLATLRAELEGQQAKLAPQDQATPNDQRLLELEQELARAKEELERQAASFAEEKKRLEEGLRQQAEAHEVQQAIAQQQIMAGAGEAERQEIQRLQSRVTEVEELLAETTGEVERLGRERDELAVKLEAEREQVQAAELKVNALRAELEEAASERDSLILRVEELEESLADRPSEGQLAAVQRELEALRESSSRRISEYMGHIDMMLAEKRALEEASASATGTTEQLGRELAEARQSVAELTERLASLPDQAEIAEVELELAELRRSADAGEQRSRQLEAELEESGQRLEEFKTKARQTFQSLAEEIGGLEEEVETAQAQLEASRQAEQELQGQVAALQQELSEARRADEREQAELQAELDDLRQQAEAKVQALRQRIAGLEAELAELQEERERESGHVQERVEELRRKRDHDLQRIGELEKQLAVRPSADQVDQLLQGRSQLESTISQLEEQLTQQELQARDDAKNLRRATMELEEAQAERERLSRKLAELQHKLDEAEAEKGRQAELRQEAGAESAELQATLDELRARLASREEELEELRTTSAAAQEGLGEEVARLKEVEIRVNEELARLQDLLQAREAAAAVLERKVAELSAVTEEQTATIEALRQAGAAGAGQAAAEPGGAAGAGGDKALEPLRALFMDINDVVSTWRNSFMQVGNYLLDLQNALEVMRQADTAEKLRAALGDVERAGSISCTSSMLRGCEDDARRIKREMIRYRDLLNG